MILIVFMMVAGLIALGVWAFLRHRWVERFRAKGWQFQTDPGPAAAYGLNVPPFGVGTNRVTDDMVFGTTPGRIPFRSFQYDSSAAHCQVACLRLPRALPEFHLGQIFAGTRGFSVPGLPVPVVAADGDYGAEVARAILPFLQGMSPLGITIDGDELVSLFAPTDADRLEQHLRALEAAHRAIGMLDLSRWPEPPIPPEMSVYRRPDWVFRPRDDGALGRVIHTASGHSHAAHNVLRGRIADQTWIALEHHWKTTEYDVDPEGRPRTETRNHIERIMEVTAPAGFPDFSVNRFSLFRQRSRFESIDFNERVKVRCSDPRFAHDVVHPRMMDLLSDARAAFEIEDGRFRMSYRGTIEHATENAELCAQFLAHIPRFVWRNLGYAEPPAGLPEWGPQAST